MGYLSAALRIVNSAALRHALSASLSNGEMRTVEEVRRLRLAQLAKEFGSVAALNDRTGRLRRDSTLSQIANGSSNSKGGKPKTMGSPIARDLEDKCAKPRGWMDTDPELWPFDRVDLDLVLGLNQSGRDMLEGALILTAAQLGLEVKRAAA